jgi:signal transduction histidine kinase
MYDNKTKIIFGHPLKNFIGRDMTSFRDSKGQSLMQLDTDSLAKNKIGYSIIYFNKPNNQAIEFPKLTCITKFEPLDLVIGIGEYLDVVENQLKEEVLERFSKFEDKDKNLFIFDVHNIEGGDKFATVLLNSNRPELVGNKVSDKDKDEKGNMFRKQFLEIIREKGEGFTQYWYKKPSTETPALKVSYIYFQKDWNWIIGSGFYSNDLEEKILLMEKSISSNINNTIYKAIIWVVLLSFLAIVIAILVSFRIDKTIKKYTNTIIDYEHNKRKQEHMLIQQSKMAAMGEMLGNIAHQWRQPLSTITTAATGAKLQKEMDYLSDTDFNYAMDSISNSAQYLSTTIDDFRSFFNPNNNKETEFLLSDMIKKTLAIVSPQFITKDIIIVKNIEEVSIKSIENELIQVLLNILNNSKDALIKLEDEKKLIFINAYVENRVIIIEIKDNAKGINEDIIDRIFEPYFTTKHQSQGTGIGLYMSQDIVKNHLNGTIEVENETYNFEEIQYTGAKFTIKISID